jgi:hypothetical protein
LAGREAPEPVVSPELSSLLIHQRAVRVLQSLPGQEVAVVASCEEAGLLALGAPGSGEAGSACLGPRCLLVLLPEGEPEPREHARVHPGEHVGLILRRIRSAGEQQTAAVLAHTGIVAGGERLGSDPLREREQGCKAKASVAADARVRSLATRVAPDEWADHGPAKALAEIEGRVRKAQPVASLARREHGFRGAAGAFRARAGRIGPEPEGDAHRFPAGPDRAQQCNRAVHAAAHRDGHALLVDRSAQRGTESVVERIGRERLTRNRRRFEQRAAGRLRAEVRDPRALARRVGDTGAGELEAHPRHIRSARRVPDQLCHGNRRTPPRR